MNTMKAKTVTDIQDKLTELKQLTEGNEEVATKIKQIEALLTSIDTL